MCTFVSSKKRNEAISGTRKKMETTTKSSNSMSVELEKALALKQHLGEEYFVLNGTIFEGTEEEARKDFEGGDEEDFFEYCFANLTEVEEYSDLNDNDYLVLTNEEADERLDEYVDYYCTEEINQIPSDLQRYFDEDSYKDDVKNDMSRGEAIASYDSYENEEEVNGATYYIYRIG